MTPSGRSVTSIRHREAGAAPDSAAATPSGVAPHSRATAAAARALPTWCAPTSRSATSAVPCAATSRNRARPASSTTSSARTSRARRPADGHHPGAGARRHRRDRRVVGVQHRDPVGRAAPRPARPSPAAIASGEPNSPRCARPTLSTTPIRGCATRHSAAMWPAPARRQLQHEVAGGRVGPQRRPGQPQLVVERPGRRDGRAERGEDGGEQVLGRRLAGASGDPDDREVRKGADVLRGEAGQRGEYGGARAVGVGGGEVAARREAPGSAAGRHDHGGGIDLAGRQHRGRARGHRGGGEVVPVGALAGQGQEQPARAHLPRVELDGRHPLLAGGAVKRPAVTAATSARLISIIRAPGPASGSARSASRLPWRPRSRPRAPRRRRRGA